MTATLYFNDPSRNIGALTFHQPNEPQGGAVIYDLALALTLTADAALVRTVGWVREVAIGLTVEALVSFAVNLVLSVNLAVDVALARSVGWTRSVGVGISAIVGHLYHAAAAVVTAVLERPHGMGGVEPSSGDFLRHKD